MDTIVAISTAPGIGGIGIIRISGKKTFQIIDKIFIAKNKENIAKISSYSIKYGYIINPKTEKKIDEVLVSYFKSPKSYTTEDMCEINCHGGNIVIQKILEICLENGAKIAEPGEFTKRAFLNGRIDLAQAESVIDIINAKTEKESIASMNQLEGFLSNNIKDIKKDILGLLADIEVSIDYPEYDVPEVANEKAIQILKKIKEELQELEESFEKGKILKEGIKLAIIGVPNSGKSSLLNAILKEERAIVTAIPGTTRDTIEEYISISGIPFKIIDTAGIRKSTDEVEKIGIKKAKSVAEQADLIIAIFDSTKSLTKEDEEILDFIKNRNAMIVLNKVDLGKRLFILPEEYTKSKSIIEISALKQIGINNLEQEIINMFKLQEVNYESSVLVTNVRHKDLIKKANKNADKSIDIINENMPIDIVSIYIKDILEELGQITGENVSEDIINEIFNNFCLGK